MSDTTYRDRVAAYLKDRPGEWVNGLEIAQVGGLYAWRTRLSDARIQLGMDIKNRVRMEGRRKVSEYRYLPTPGQMALFQEIA
jgi:hypothetical protein